MHVIFGHEYSSAVVSSATRTPSRTKSGTCMSVWPYRRPDGLRAMTPGYSNYWRTARPRPARSASTRQLGARASQRPRNAHDFIVVPSWPRWISPYMYRKTSNNRDRHPSAPADPRKVRPLLIFAFAVEPDGPTGSRKIDKIKSHVVARLPGFVPSSRGQEANRPSSWSMAMTGSSRATRAGHPCSLSPRMLLRHWMTSNVTTPRIRRGDAMVRRGDAHSDQARRFANRERLDVGEAPSIEVRQDRNGASGSLVLHIRVRHPRSLLHVSLCRVHRRRWPDMVACRHRPWNRPNPLVVDASSLPGG